MAREFNYTTEQTKLMIEEYVGDPNMTTVNYLATTLGKSAKSIVGKLAKEGVYRKEEYFNKSGEKPETKPEIIAKIKVQLEEKSSNNVNLIGLEKAGKTALIELLGHLKSM